MRSLPISFTAVVLASALSGQAPVGIDGGIVPIHTATDRPDGEAYETWAAGPRYKTSFHGEMTFVPYLGADYPHNQPWSWRTASVQLGNAELLDAGEQPTRWHDEQRYEYRYALFTEVYEVREQGLAQSFVIRSRPAAAGDLVITGRLQSDLRARVEPARHGTLTFRDEDGTAILDYGAATAIDASGRSLPIASRYDGDGIALTVPADWMREAAWPVTVDPLLIPRQIEGSGPIFGMSDIARDDSNDQILVAYLKHASGNDADVYARLYRDNWNGGTTVFSETTNNEATWVSCAAGGLGQDFCVAYAQVDGLRDSTVSYHVHPGGQFSFLPTTTSIPSPPSTQQWRPDVGGTLRGFGGWMIAYQQEAASSLVNTPTSGVYIALIDSQGNVGAQRPIGLGLSWDNERPVVNQGRTPRFGGSSWVVAWQAYDGAAANPEWRIVARQVDQAGNSSPAWFASPPDGVHALGPQIAGTRGRYLVTYTGASLAQVPGKTARVNGYSAVTQRLDWPHGGNPSSDPPADLIAPLGTRRVVLGGTAYDHETRSHWAVQILSDRANSGSGRAFIFRVGYRGHELEQARLQNPPTPTSNGVRGGATFDPDGDLFLTCWAMSPGDLTANKFVYPSGSCTAVTGTSCSSAVPAWSGSDQIGSEFSGVTLTGAPPNTLAFLLVSLSKINQALTTLPGCRLLVPSSGPSHVGTVTQATNSAGRAFVGLKLPEFLLPTPAYFQWFYVEPPGGSRPLSSTARVEVCLLK